VGSHGDSGIVRLIAEAEWRSAGIVILATVAGDAGTAGQVAINARNTDFSTSEIIAVARGTTYRAVDPRHPTVKVWREGVHPGGGMRAGQLADCPLVAASTGQQNETQERHHGLADSVNNVSHFGHWFLQSPLPWQ